MKKIKKNYIAIILILIIIIISLFFLNKKDIIIEKKIEVKKEAKNKKLEKNEQKEVLNNLLPKIKLNQGEIEEQKKILDQLNKLQPENKIEKPDYLSSEKGYQEQLLKSLR
jgi:predicted Holliday junction resolvase-like endonuclease